MNDRPHTGAKTIKFLEKQCSIDRGQKRKYQDLVLSSNFLNFLTET